MKTKKQTFAVLLAGGIVALLACGAAYVGGGGSSSGGGGVTEGQAGTIASNAASSLNLWTNAEKQYTEHQAKQNRLDNPSASRTVAESSTK